MRTIWIMLEVFVALVVDASVARAECSQSNIASYVPSARRAEGRLDFHTKLASYTKAAACGDAASMNEVAWMYFGSNDIPGRHFQDYARAAYWFQKAANLNYVPAISQLGVMYGSDGSLGVPADQSKATTLFLKAARLGDAQAMDNLGYRYMRGLGVATNLHQAIFWWKRAVATGGEGGKAAQTWLDQLGVSAGESGR